MDALYAARAEIFLGGHDHNYQRFRKQRPDGSKDSTYGLRSFVVGTGGKNIKGVGSDGTDPVEYVLKHGFLELDLEPGRYGWRFRDEGGTVRDSGSDAPCRS